MRSRGDRGVGGWGVGGHGGGAKWGGSGTVTASGRWSPASAKVPCAGGWGRRGRSLQITGETAELPRDPYEEAPQGRDMLMGRAQPKKHLER